MRTSGSWQAEAGSRSYATDSRAYELNENTALNTPKAAYVEGFFTQALGINGVTSCWTWRRMSNASAKAKLDRYVTLRGDIAHRGGAAAGVKKSDVRNLRNHVERLVELTDGYINTEAQKIVGVAL